MAIPIITRKDAISQGLSYYFTGKPCKHGHLSKRFAVCGKCYECHEERRKTDSYKEKVKERLIKNRDKMNAQRAEYRRKWRANNKERDRQNDRNYKQKNKAKILERQRERYHADPDKHRAYQVNYNKKNLVKEKKKIYFAKWSKENRHLLRIKEGKRRALEYGANGEHTHEQAKQILINQNYKCANCLCCIKERSSRHLDHIMPLSKGGTNYISNIEWLCKSCNLRKNAKDPIDWAPKNGRLL